MKSVKVCLVISVLSGGSAATAESVVSIRRLWIDEAHPLETPNRRVPLLSQVNFIDFDVDGPFSKREPLPQRMN
jgi:hypothetical protein